MINAIRKCEYFLRTIDYYREIIELSLMNCKHSKVIAAYYQIISNISQIYAIYSFAIEIGRIGDGNFDLLCRDTYE